MNLEKNEMYNCDFNCDCPLENNQKILEHNEINDLKKINKKRKNKIKRLIKKNNKLKKQKQEIIDYLENEIKENKKFTIKSDYGYIKGNNDLANDLLALIKGDIDE